MRSPADADVMQIEITSKCHKRCANCTHGVGMFEKDWEMSRGQFRTAIISMGGGWNKPNKLIGLIGGEPTLHSDFEYIAKLFGDIWGGSKVKPIGRAPITDLNKFAEERLYDRTSGRGLWTALGPGFYKHFETIMDTFDHFNMNTHESNGLHQAMWVHREDYCKQTGMSSEEWEKNRDKCWVQTTWSPSISKRGAYFCEVAAAIDNVLFDGKSAWPVEAGWWRRQPKDFNDQLHLCDHCSLAQPGPSTVDHMEADIVSATNRIALQTVNAPKLKRIEPTGFVGDYGGRVITTKDSYVDEFRVAPAHDSLKPRSITTIVTAFGEHYMDKLVETLKHNVKQVGEIIVVIGSGGPYPEIINHLASSVVVVNSDKAFAFNKGQYINAAMQTANNPDWILLVDADVFLNPTFKESMSKVQALNPGVLYGAPRYSFANEKAQEDFIAGRSFAVKDPKSNLDMEPNGYFQLFNVRAQAIAGRWPKVMSEEFCSAGGVDSWFKNQFPIDKQVVVKDWSILHCVDDSKLGSRWNGPPAPTVVLNQWRQAYMMTPFGYIPVEPVPEVDAGFKLEWKLTDSLRGDTAVVPQVDRGYFGDVVKANGKGGFLFNGNDIGTAHIHVAYRFVKRS